jgi:predicted secreted protein
MSNLNDLALIIATFISGIFLIVYITKHQNEAGNDVLLGIIRGVPISTEARWIILLQVFVSLAGAILLVDFFLTFALLKIAGRVDEDLRWLAYLGASITGLGFVLQLSFGTSAFFKYASILRRTTRD